MNRRSLWWSWWGSTLAILFALWIALPSQLTIPALPIGTPQVTMAVPRPSLQRLGSTYQVPANIPLGLDIQGGTQVTLAADMSGIPESDRPVALESAAEVIRRRIDLFGINETTLRTSVFQDQYTLMVELPGIQNPQDALELIGQTAQLQFWELTPVSLPDEEADATASALLAGLDSTFAPTQLGGQHLQRSTVQFDPQTGQPVVALTFNPEGAQLFAELTERNVGQPIGIFLDQQPVSSPLVNQPIYGGQATITGDFTLEEAELLATQLNAGALPVPISVLEQTSIGPSLGQASLEQSVRAGFIGLVLVAVFMILIYRGAGVIALLALIAYAILTLALYKLIPVTLTLPGIAGLMLSIGMAVDANILTFERVKEETRAGADWSTALKRGFGRSWDSIKDANIATLIVCFVLFNPFEWGFLHTSGPVRGFALTLALGIAVSLLTGVYYSRLLTQLFLRPPQSWLRKERT